MADRPFSSDVIDAVYSGFVGDSFDADKACDAVLVLLAAHDAEVRAGALHEFADDIESMDNTIVRDAAHTLDLAHKLADEARRWANRA